MQIRLLIADDHPLFRSGLYGILEKDDDFRIIAEAGSFDEVIEKLQTCEVDVAVLDLSMPGELSAPKAVESILEKDKDLKVVVLTMHEDEYYVREMFRVGAKAYVLKRSDPREAVNAVRAAFRGQRYIDPRIGGQLIAKLSNPPPAHDEPRAVALTAREKDVCALLALGYTNTEAAERLGISERTVETHRRHIMDKLKLQNRAGLVRFAIDHDLMTRSA